MYTKILSPHKNIHKCTFIHTGKDTSLNTDDVGVTHAVLKLLEGLEHRGHHIYMDNYYTSLALFQDLRRLGFGACGTVRVNRRGVPQSMKSKLQKGEIISENALKWMDKRPVTMLTTVHDDSVVTKQRRTRAAPGGREDVRKPVVIVKYNEWGGPWRPAPLVLWVLTLDAEVVEESTVSSGRGCHRECVHNVLGKSAHWKAPDSQRIPSPAGERASDGHG